jgi:hypothetical protein
MNRELVERGLKARREVLGAEHFDKSITNASAFNLPMQERVTTEVLLQTAIYRGVLAAIDNFRNAKEVFNELRI